ncbi:MAG: putative pyridoxal-dependent aspartate 1-decarboxylase [Desulfobacterales bacterium]|nr:putative pyridoxal-dependent aspartate 1-decarboxylase [Desulfobacterales bacterium]
MNDKMGPLVSKTLVADWQALERTFLRPENEEAKNTLLKYMEQILFGLNDFLKAHVGITEEKSLKDLSEQFSETRLPKTPEKKLAEVITDLVQDIAPHAVNVASPYFVGHMTAAIPFFMVHLKSITAALNQNVVKLETSKVVSILEKQILAKIHRLVFNREEAFYAEHVQKTESALGCFTEDGTIANITALWVARNRLFGPKPGFDGIEKQGVAAAYSAYDLDRCVILVSRLGHYSLRKAGGILGIGNENVIAIDVDQNHHLDLQCLQKKIRQLKNEGKTRILAIIGIAGATETGTIDPLEALSEISRTYGVHFHIDAAWGGPTLMSDKYRHLLKGIELGDSVTIDGHKQFYMPMSCGMVYFKDPQALDAIAYHARYINRPGSVDLGIKSLSGSREANSLILDSALKIMGTNGYALLIDHGIRTAREFADEIERRADFELTTPPTLNILTYRLYPAKLKQAFADQNKAGKKRIYDILNNINRDVQRHQREAGKSFVSRTSLKGVEPWADERVVLRVVIMNPMTDIRILREILDEQERIYRRTESGYPDMDA